MMDMASYTQEIRVDVEVQPPGVVGVGRRLIPPVVARINDPQLIDDYLNGAKDVFATLMLTLGNGQDQTGILNGNYNVRGQPITIHSDGGGSGGGSSSSSQGPQKFIYFIFTGLSIPVAGTYTFTVCVNTLSFTQGFVLTVGGKTTRQFRVVNEAVAPARPGRSEARALRMLEKNGLYDPSA
ncbi:hypothetical protein Daus18300_013229 [Diaporthe australafricana]|uniref:Velvet domain-containing protein n=1 Tax=Diaporthe australafricana TaxID=127596 RepID=A0ABR3W013_9PEZI